MIELLKEPKSEFEKAKKEAAKYTFNEEYYGFLSGADWAYEWFINNADYHFNQAMSNGQMLTIAREALEELNGKCISDGPYIIEQALTKLEELERGE